MFQWTFYVQRDLHIKCRFQHMLQIHRHHHPSHQEHGEILMTKYMIENTFWMENVLHKAIFFPLTWMNVIIWDLILWSMAPPFALKSDNSFGVCLSNCDMNVDSSDMPLILRNSSQICKEKYTILVIYQKWYVFFCDLNMTVLDTN